MSDFVLHIDHQPCRCLKHCSRSSVKFVLFVKEIISSSYAAAFHKHRAEMRCANEECICEVERA